MSAIPTTDNQEEEVKRAAEIKEWLESKISELELEISRLKDMLVLVDSTLRKTSFVPAIALRGKPESNPSIVNQAVSGKEAIPTKSGSEKEEKPFTEVSAATSEASQNTEPFEGAKVLRRSADGKVLASAFVEPDKVVIVPEPGYKLSQLTPPFQSFFVNRILKGYQLKDEEQSKSGTLPQNRVLQFSVQETDGNIASITVTNYREKIRLNEILSTVTWAFTRMLEKK